MMMGQRFLIWTGGGRGDPEAGPRSNAIPVLPAPAPLPRAALITYWWGKTRFEMAASACSVRTTLWGTGQMTWLHCKAVQTLAIKPDASAEMRNVLIPAHYVTAVKPGPTYQITHCRTSGDIGLFPPTHPAPPHALPLTEIERALQGLAAAPTGPAFSISYPLFALKRDSGSYVGFDMANARPAGTGFGIPVFTTEARAARFLQYTEIVARIKPFDRVAVFRGFLRSIRDAGTFVLFDPLPNSDNLLYTDHAYPAAVVLERFLPEATWGWDYPVYLLRFGPGFACIDGDVAGRRVKMLVVFTDSDLADRAVAAAREPLAAVPVADREAFARLVRELNPDVGGAVFDPPDPVRGGVAKTALSRENLLANLENMDL
jgi:hypothetical protein